MNFPDLSPAATFALLLVAAACCTAVYIYDRRRDTEAHTGLTTWARELFNPTTQKETLR